jgi:cardiolipin synthase (CMP-forming)
VDPARAETRPAAGRVLTIPNMISFARLAGVPIFLYLFLVKDAPGAALTVLILGGASDWVDGYLARRLGQVSRLGELMDPAADRLYILATVLALTARAILPWQYTTALLARELVMGCCLLALRRHGHGPPQVHYLGKAATFLLLFAFPFLLLAAASPGVATAARVCGWAFGWWGIVLYWIAAALYLAQARTLIRSGRRDGAPT